MAAPIPGLNLSSALEHDQFSDLKIKCKSKESSVHKVVVCTQSSVLLDAVTRDFKEGHTSVLDLSEHDDELSQAFICFLYSADYRYPPANDPITAATTKPSQIAFHVDMYCLGDKYDILRLRLLAQTKLASVLNDLKTPREDVLNAIEPIYKGTPQTDRNLRDIVVNAVRMVMVEFLNAPSLNRQLTEILREIPEFGIDTFMSFVKIERPQLEQFGQPRKLPFGNLF